MRTRLIAVHSDGKALDTLAEKNKVAAQTERWQELDTVLKESYNDKAKSSEPKAYGKRKEIGRVLSQLSDVVS